jgi:hypothetical protein
VSLLAMAVCQSTYSLLTDCYREQAKAYRGSVSGQF